MSEAECLHRGGPPGRWGNLGLWSGADQPYAEAAAALADAVSAAARMAELVDTGGDGPRVACLACGAGDEGLRLLQRLPRLQLVGVERAPAAADAARQRFVQAGCAQRAQVHTQPVLDWLAAADDPQPFDAMLCVDAAYHLQPLERLFAGVRARLRPGGRFAFTARPHAGDGLPPRRLRAAAALCGVKVEGLTGLERHCAQLRAAGFVDVQAQVLDGAVLDGFARFVRRQTRRLGHGALHPAWLRPALTAALIGPCRRAGLGYALFSGQRPG